VFPCNEIKKRENMPDNYQILLSKLDEFIRKYYRNRLLKGLILYAGILILSFLVVAFLEYIGHFGSVTRTILFYLFIAVNACVFYFYIADPILKMRKIGKIISYEQASRIIGEHFSEIRDKLLNTLQLKKLDESGSENIELVKASIDQKIIQIRPVPFLSAIDLSKNRKFLRYALPPLFLFLLLAFIAPSFITRPTERILYYNTEFAVEMPFHLLILNKSLEAFQQEDFTLNVKVTGEQIPEEIFLETEGASFKLRKDSKILFSYTFKTLQKTTRFRLVGGKYNSEEYELKVYPRPTILNYSISLGYPAYLNRKEEVLENTGDFIIPEGTKVTWRIFTKDVDEIEMRVDTITKSLVKTNGNTFEYSGIFSKSIRYSLRAGNSYVKMNDSLSYGITVIQDAFPTVVVTESKDSAVKSRLYFQGVIKDDYGFSRLTFNYTIAYNGDTAHREMKTENLPIDKSINQQQFYYSIDLSQVIKNPGDQLDFYFEVCDNDGIHGPKCSKSGMFQFNAPTLEAIENLTAKQEQSITKDLQTTLSEAKKLEQQVDDLNKRMIDKNSINWQDKKQLEDLLDRQQQVKENLEKIQKQNEEKNSYEEQYKNIDQSIMDKQKQLNELFNQVMDEKMKKLFEELKQMMDKLDKDKVNDLLEKMKLTDKDLEKQLDRSLELFKQIEFEKDLAETIEKLNKLAEKQDKLSEDTKKDENTAEKLQQDQKDIKENFNDVKKKIDDLEDKNKKLEEPNNFPNTEKAKEDVDKELNNSSQSLEKKNRKDASKSQQKASGAMKSLAQQLQDMQNEMDEDQLAEDTERLREILENLLRISFDQEDLIAKTQNTQHTDPKYLKIIQDQNDLKDDLSMVEDSLYQLAKRQIMIKPFVMREISGINQNVDDAVSSLNARNVQAAAAKQQYVMTSVNNLALLLSEALKQMESNLQSEKSKSGKSSCQNGKTSGKKSMKNIRAMQEAMNEKLQKLNKEMQSQKKEGKEKTGKSGDGKMSEQLARLAAEQEAIRNEMSKYMQQLKEEGIKDQNGLNDAALQMEQTQKDLVNKRIMQETFNRQKEILTRLLESEKAEQKRDLEEKRESTEAKEGNYSNPKGNFQYNNQKSSSTELLKTVQPSYNYFYKNKINSYFLKFDR
jgi:hypothetical protein